MTLRTILAIWVLAWAGAAMADTVVPTRTLRAQTIIAAADLAVRPKSVPGTVSNPTALIGKETRVALYPGRPVRPGDVGPPAIIERNQIVRITYAAAGLRITADARSLSRAGVGDRVRVMNLSSHATLTGTVQSDGTVSVQP
jgi:flagella basal body P-ring formation protein FlgA